MDNKYRAINCHMVIHAMEKTRAGKELAGRGVVILNWVDGESLSYEVESEQKPERGEGGSHEVMGAGRAVTKAQRGGMGEERRPVGDEV